MRCDEVTRELAVPSDGRDPAELDRHLAGCLHCSAHAEGFRRLDDLWAATRPVEPSGAVFDEIWARVTEAAGPAPETIPFRRSSSWRRPVLGGMIVAFAAAAAVMIACLGPFGPNVGRQPTPAGPTSPPPSPLIARNFEVDTGQVLFIHVNENDAKGVRRPAPDNNDMALADFDLLNRIENLD